MTARRAIEELIRGLGRRSYGLTVTMSTAEAQMLAKVAQDGLAVFPELPVLTKPVEVDAARQGFAELRGAMR